MQAQMAAEFVAHSRPSEADHAKEDEKQRSWERGSISSLTETPLPDESVQMLNVFVWRTKAGFEEIVDKTGGRLALQYNSCLHEVTSTHQGPLPFTKAEQRAAKQQASASMVGELYRQLVG